jgi:hypothetical protein
VAYSETLHIRPLIPVVFAALAITAPTVAPIELTAVYCPCTAAQWRTSHAKRLPSQDRH